MKVLMFWMRDCNYCNKLKNELKKLPTNLYSPILIEYPNMSLQQKSKYEIKMFPTLVFLADDNRFLNKLEGYNGIDRIIQEYQKNINLENIMKRN